ncbi:response regulator transcription factor [Streptomyces sp. NBC_01356]|uniref:response regulator transcription factor n=1 Tax=Streptomyces sp. NBC_01356 TaxID=2903836 RepID=UPI002E355D99|nr:response regulator transcription factor [Streptomyces sp. NBC_01356]
MDVLVVEDDDGMAEALQQMLGLHGYDTRHSGTGTAALADLPGTSLVLLDLSLPDLAGHEVCRRIRENSCVPIVVLSGSDHELDRVTALYAGADDFVPKPFNHHELLARIEAVLRRSTCCCGRAQESAGADSAPAPVQVPRPRRTPPEPAQEVSAAQENRLRAGPLRLDSRTRRVFLDDEEIRVTRKEFDLLAMLLEEPGAVMQREDIMARVWDENWFGSTRTLDVHVGSLRTKLGSTRWIETVRGVGYRLTVPAVLGAGSER